MGGGSEGASGESYRSGGSCRCNAQVPITKARAGIDLSTLKYIDSDKSDIFGTNPVKKFWRNLNQAGLEDGTRIEVQRIYIDTIYVFSDAVNKYVPGANDSFYQQRRFSYLCHSLSFNLVDAPGGPFFISGKTVDTVLKSGFNSLKKDSDVACGDIMVWRLGSDDGGVEHSAIITDLVNVDGKLSGTTKLRSKNGIEEEGTFFLEGLDKTYSDATFRAAWRRK